jgi:ribosome-associated protein
LSPLINIFPEHLVSSAKFEHRPVKENHDDNEMASRSQLKRDAHAIKSLASELIKLKPSQLAKIPLEDDLLEAIQEAQGMNSHGARRRQLQYSAKLIRRIDTDAITEALDRLKSGSKRLTAGEHRVESWRDHLLENGDAALAKLIQGYSELDAQTIRQLVRNAQREQKLGKAPLSARKLYRLLRQLDNQQTLPTAS